MLLQLTHSIYYHNLSAFVQILGFNYPKATDQSIMTNGLNLDKGLCGGFDSLGNDSGVSASIVDNIDYNNAFVGQYMAGDIQYNGHHSYGSDNLLYWKETKPFQNECSAREWYLRVLDTCICLEPFSLLNLNSHWIAFLLLP